MRLVKKQRINQLLGEELPEKITSGQVVKGMALNGLGLVSSPLYLFSKFFEGKAIEHLIGKGVKTCLLYTSPSPRDTALSRMPSSA